MLTQIGSEHQIVEQLPWISRRRLIPHTGMVISPHRLFQHFEELCNPERRLGLGLLLVPVVTAALAAPHVTGHRVIGADPLVITLRALLCPEAGLQVPGPRPADAGGGAGHSSVARTVHNHKIVFL